jgi:diguanylate cyclase (GGDEF)-like protein
MDISHAILLIALVVTLFYGWQWKREAEKYKNLSTIDLLTGILNRRGFEARIEEEIIRFRRTAKPFSLLIIDLNNLKWVNDTKSHVQGDQFIIDFVTLLKSLLRGSDMFARIGGDEFAVILGEDNEEAAALTVQRLDDAFWNNKGNIPFFRGAAIGAATFSSKFNTAASLIAEADKAMYSHKKLLKSPGSRWMGGT